MKDLALTISMGESLIDFRNPAANDEEKAKSQPKKKKFEKKTAKAPFWKPQEERQRRIGQGPRAG